MASSVLIEERFEIPLGMETFADFRRWALSESFPEGGRIDYVQGRIEVDMSPEDPFSHGSPKIEIVLVLGRRVKELDLGRLFVDSTRVSCLSVELSAEPDVVFVSYDAIDSGQVRLVPKATGLPDRFIELEGAPDLIVELASDGSVTKDTQRLPSAYFAAGVREFWLVDARRNDLIFQIHRRGPTGFEPIVRDTNGFQSSVVLNRMYRLDRHRDQRGFWAYDLRESG